MPSYDWVSQLDPLVREVEALAGAGRRLVAVTLAVPGGAPLDLAARLLADALTRAGLESVQVSARHGGSLQVLAAEFASSGGCTGG